MSNIPKGKILRELFWSGRLQLEEKNEILSLYARIEELEAQLEIAREKEEFQYPMGGSWEE